MSLHLNHTKTTSIDGKISITGSKSESNRLLVLQQFFPHILIDNLSNSDDTKSLQDALNLFSSSGDESISIDVGHAGTTMRFLTAYLAIQNGKTTRLTGSKRMQERPIKILVNALVELGADIKYLKENGYPPLLIKGRELTCNKINIKGNVSSQYISALLLIAPSLPKGLELVLEGEITSIPYIEMTLALLDEIGVNTVFTNNKILVKPIQNSKLKIQNFSIEPDWSSASYYYSLVALQANSKIELSGFKKNSLQGDSILPEIYKKLGVKTTFTNSGILLESSNSTLNSKLFTLNLINSPDLAQTIAVTCLGLGKNCHLTGLHTLKIKETDRLQALKNELEKFGAIITITDDSLLLKASKKLTKNIRIKTYQDHRMALAFAPLLVKVPIDIENPNVVSKSYPNFWEDLNSLFIKND